MAFIENYWKCNADLNLSLQHGIETSKKHWDVDSISAHLNFQIPRLFSHFASLLMHVWLFFASFELSTNSCCWDEISIFIRRQQKYWQQEFKRQQNLFASNRLPLSLYVTKRFDRYSDSPLLQPHERQGISVGREFQLDRHSTRSLLEWCVCLEDCLQGVEGLFIQVLANRGHVWPLFILASSELDMWQGCSSNPDSPHIAYSLSSDLMIQLEWGRKSQIYT